MTVTPHTAPRVLALSWRDCKAPKAGGAEVYTHEVLRYAASQGAQVTHISMAFPGGEAETVIDGVRYLRAGGPLGVILFAFRWYRRHRATVDVVMDQCNTHCFFTPLWVPRRKRLLLIHQLTREIWDYHVPFPMNRIGKAAENSLLRLYRRNPVVTVSQSTKDDLTAIGFAPERIRIIRNCLPAEAERAHLADVPKEPMPTFIYMGRYARYKGIDRAVMALGLLRKRYPNARLWLVGKPDQAYIKTTLTTLCEAAGMRIGPEDENAVIVKGFVSEAEKFRLCATARALLFPSVREGWGIIVSEAAIMGTPSIVFDAPGCRDAVDYGRAGYLCRENTTDELARLMAETLTDGTAYAATCQNARMFARGLSRQQTDEAFYQLLQGFTKVDNP